MKERLLSAAVMIAIGLPCILIGDWPMKLLLTFIAVCMAVEISSLKKKKDYILIAGISLYLISVIYHLVVSKMIYNTVFFIGILLMVIAMSRKEYVKADRFWMNLLSLLCGLALFFIIRFYEIHQYLLLYALLTSLVCDAGAYFVGRKLGKHKMAPTISPKKTIEGAVGGVIVATIVAIVFAYFMNWFGLDAVKMCVVSFVLTLISEIGDLFFSYVKRKYGIKDYGNLIPGHGGVLDRVDSVIFVIVVLGFIIVL